MKQIKAPNMFKDKIYVFLAGSIEMGKAEDWQQKVVKELSEFDNVVILNPRRDDWDSSWKQSIYNDKFKEQVEWELTALEKADYIIMNFIGFWRKGNVDIVCKRYHGHIPYSNINDLISEFKEMLLLQK